jgi:hypothetical protein
LGGAMSRLYWESARLESLVVWNRSGEMAVHTIGCHRGDRVVKSALFVLLCLALGGCAVVAAPCRATADIVQTAPLVGNVVAAPPAACADVIDPR